jgi:hypothetical protein
MRSKVYAFIVILLFCIFTSYNLYSWNYEKDYNKIETGLNQELQELREMVNDSKIERKIDEIEAYINFQQALFLEEEE